MKLYLATILAIVLASAAPYALGAKHANYPGCTTDNVAVVLGLQLDDDAPASVSAHIAKVFSSVAAQFSVDGLLSPDGFHAFVSALSAEDVDAIESLDGPPQVVGKCGVGA